MIILSAETLSFDESDFDDLVPLTTEELGAHVDQLTDMAARQPTEKLVSAMLSQSIAEISRRGDISMAQQVAMTLGALACNDPHLEALAGEASSVADALSRHNTGDGHGHSSGESGGHKHEKKNSKKKRDRSTTQPLSKFLLTFKLKPQSFFPPKK